MSKIKDYALALLFVIAIFAVIVLSIDLGGFVVTHPSFVSWLEAKRISVYWIVDTLWLVTLIALICGFISLTMKRSSEPFKIITLLLIWCMILMNCYYPSVPRQDIGYFYRIPEGQSITYPKYPKSAQHTGH
jgi:cytochrome c biogenesis factor